MAGKKKNASGYDRWDTVTGTIRMVGKNTPEQQKVVDAINASRSGKKQPTTKKKK